MMRGRAGYLALVLLFCLAWSSCFPGAKIAIHNAPPDLFQGVRFSLSGGALLAMAWWRGEMRGRAPWGTLILLGLLNQGGYNFFAWRGMGTASAGIATIITSLTPILVAAFAAPMLGERMHWRKAAGLVLGFAGAVYVVRNRIALGEDPTGIILLLIALGSLVAGTLLFKLLNPAATLLVAVGAQQSAAGAAMLVTGLLSEHVSDIVFGPVLFLTMAWFVLIGSMGSLLLWFYLLRRGSASSASALHFLMPPLGLAMNWAVLGEPVSPADLLGVVPIGLGIWLATRAEPVRVAVLT
jgi:drug/metabolite transporter (DMT)-like permease